MKGGMLKVLSYWSQCAGVWADRTGSGGFCVMPEQALPKIKKGKRKKDEDMGVVQCTKKDAR
jgi:hypothetical protein